MKRKRYSVKELFYTIQGEGFHAGRPAVFCRFAGCNLWSGREEDRAEAVCSFCDTDFVGIDGPGGGRYTAEELAQQVRALWPADASEPIFVVLTGGEPMLQLTQELVDALKALPAEISIETNGTIAIDIEGIDWITVSPKAGAPLRQRSGNELKLVYPQEGLDPQSLEHLAFEHYYLQPMDGPELKRNMHMVVEYCKRRPKWKVSLQTHKWMGIP